MPLAGGVVLLCLSLPLPGCVFVLCPLVDFEFCHTEVHMIPLLKGVFGGEQFHRIPNLPCAQESCWHTIKRTLKRLVNRSNERFLLHEVSPLYRKVLTSFSDPFSYRYSKVLA